MSDHYDVLIVGGGMVGSALANALAPGGLRVAILEATPPAPATDAQDYDLRVSAITRASQCIFQNLRAWDAMVARRVSPFREMEVWDATGPGSIHFDSADLGEDTLGYIVENRVIQQSLLDHLKQWPNVQLFAPAVVESHEVDDRQVAVILEDGRQLAGRLLVAADGSRSRIRTQAGIAVKGWGYDQTAVVATVRPERDHRETAWQRFLPTGPLAFLPLSDGCCSIVWSTSPQAAEELMNLPDAAFMMELEQAFDSTLGAIVATSARAAFPLRLQHARDYVRPRLALIGDAAHTIHPLAGQGVNLGLLDAAVLAEVLLQAADTGHDIGAFGVLRRYERWRKGENLAVMAAMDGFKRLFGNQLSVVRVARNLGLSLVDRAGPLKQMIVRRAMGLTGDLPQLARARMETG